ncbi:MAG: cysteine hydrolase [archaeon YNP-LCB-003-016]|uniref:cysteine hydrolase family protein n=1 Tax=Candidatus Culexarchaeum yellowstonense TaxID=2928963 RepID=UPI0026EEDDF6|nr:isochorismatase family cysteine hydrolase [Candidatus Culexarchaeum yellowstonense]MCR6691763.1 cysteine hydrolase [Candidatus Culexarchaeum yellowstonense]
MKSAIVVIDMAKDFVYGSLKCERALRIIPNLKRLIEEARRLGVPIIYVNDSHLPVDFEMKLWGEHSMKGSEGSKVIDEIAPEKGDYVLEKRVYSAFYETGLDPLLRSLGVDTVILTGLHTNICVRHTAADAFFRGYKIIVPSDAVEAFTEKDHIEGLEYLKRIYGAEITDVERLLKDIEKMYR